MENTGDTITAEESVSTETDSNADSESANALSESAPISNTEVTDDDQELKMEINSEDEVENSRTVELANKEPDSQRSENEASLSDHLETLEDENGSDKEELEKVSISNGAVEDKSVTKVPKGRKRKVTDTTLLPEQSSEKDDEKKPKPNDLDSELKPDSKDEPSFIEANLNLPTKEAFGKGKRARIPNKRYSDISLTSKQSANKSFENGSEKIELENEVVEEPLSPTAHKSKDNPTTTKKIKTVDMKDPKLLKPFKFGWRRELVWRGTPDSNNRLTSDIYYYTPHGKKVRSMREVADNLTNKELTLENFSYFKAPIGLDPDKETIRHAKKPNAQSNLVKKVLGKSTPKSPSLSPTPEPERVLSPKLASPKVLSPKNSSPKIVSSKPTSPKITSPKVTTPKVTSPKASKPAPKASTPKALSPKQVTSETVEPTIRTRAAANRGATPKSKVPPKKDKRITRSEETMEVDSSPATKPAPPKKGRWAKANSTPAAAATVAAPKLKKRTIKLSSITNSEEKEENKFMENYLQNLSYGYSTLLYVFQYLKVQDLLRAGCVCTMWRDIAGHPMLWRTVRMKNSQVHSFEGLANSLKKHGTRHLDLRKMLLPNGGDEIWPEFSKAIEKVDTLLKIELCRCPASVVENLAISNPQLEVINAVTIKCESMDLEPLKALINIKELRLKSTGGLTLTSNLDSLRDMKQLRHLSLTSIRDLDRLNLNVIAELTNLESLDLGECTDFPKSFGSEILVKLDKLEKLRLEKGQGCCHTFDILDAVKNMMRLEQLELVNFDIKAGFDKALGVCQNIKKLLIIPTYISQSATTNHMVLGGVLRLQKSLSHFVWGVTLELLRVTELFVDQCEEPDKKDKRDKKGAGNGGDSIPVLKPVPLLIDRDGEIPPAHDPPQVEILALPSLQKLLMQNLPTTRVKILKIPFHATWRQSITDSVN